MKIGICSDVHGDYASLCRALEFFQANAVDQIVCAGDLVEKGSCDDQVVAKFAELQIPCVQGNHDENAIRHHRLSDVFKIEGESPLRQESIDYLKSLPVIFERRLEEKNFLVAHATLTNNAGSIFQDKSHKRLSKVFKKELNRFDFDILIVGHTHRPFEINFRGKRILNPGATCQLKHRDSHTAGIFELPQGLFQVFSLENGSVCDIERIELPI